MNEFYLRNKRSIDRGVFLLLITVVVYAFFTVLFPFLGPFFFGLLIALLMEPLVRIIVTKLKWKRWVASIICLLLFIAVLGSIGAWLIGTLLNQARNFLDSAPYHAAEIGERLNDFNLRLQRLEESMPENMNLPSIQELLLNVVTMLFGEGLDQGMRIATVIPNFFLNMMLALISAYFFMSDRETIFKTIAKACPKWISKQMAQTKKGLKKAMSGYFRAQYILMLVVGTISIAGLLIMRNDYALFLGLLFAVLDFLPIIGTGAVLIPWALLSLAMGDFHQAIGLGVMYGVITITRQVMQPKILGDQMGAHPLASLMSIFIGFRIFGLLGLVIGPSLLMIFIAIYESKNESSL